MNVFVAYGRQANIQVRLHIPTASTEPSLIAPTILKGNNSQIPVITGLSDLDGGQGVRTTLKNHKNIVFLRNNDPVPL